MEDRTNDNSLLEETDLNQNLVTSYISKNGHSQGKCIEDQTSYLVI